jgi:hypothetical protein
MGEAQISTEIWACSLDEQPWLSSYFLVNWCVCSPPRGIGSTLTHAAALGYSEINGREMIRDNSAMYTLSAPHPLHGL